MWVTTPYAAKSQWPGLQTKSTLPTTLTKYLQTPGGTLIICLPIQEVQRTQVQSLGQEDPLEEEMATHFGIVAWKIPWTEKPGGLQSRGSKTIRHD